MKKVLSLALRRAPGKIAAELFADSSDNPVNIVDRLNEMFPNINESLVRIKIIADDGIELIAFGEELARDIIDGVKAGSFVTTQNKPVKLLSSELSGDFPFLGILEGEAHQWSASGMSFKDSKDDISIIVKNN